jgi:transposase
VTSPTFGEVTVVFFQDADELKYLLMKPNMISAVRIIVAHKLRWWIEEFFKICKSYLKIEKFQMVKENEVYGHICLRIMCFMVVCFCARRICRETIQKTVRKLNRYWFEWFPGNRFCQAFCVWRFST